MLDTGQDDYNNHFCISLGSQPCAGSYWSQAGDQPDVVSDMSAGEVFLQHTEHLPLAVQQRQHQARQTLPVVFQCMFIPGLSTPTLTAGVGQHISM